MGALSDPLSASYVLRDVRVRDERRGEKTTGEVGTLCCGESGSVVNIVPNDNLVGTSCDC